MTDINAIMTQMAKTGLTNPAAAGAQSDKAGNTGGAGVSFFDMIFARLTMDNVATDNMATDNAAFAAGLTQNTVATADQGPVIPANPLLTLLNLNDAQASLIATDPAAINVESTAMISSDGLDLTADGAAALQATLDSLLQGLPADQKPVLVNMNTAQLKKALEKLSIDLQSAADGNASLIATGLTPQDLTALIDQLDHVQNQGENTLMVGVMQMIQTGTELQATFIPRAIIDGKVQAPVTDGEPTDDLAAALNALNVGGSADADAAGTVIDTPAESAVKSRRGDLGEFLKLLEQFQGKTADATHLLITSDSGRAIGERAFYVGVTRGRDDMTIYTDSKAKARELISVRTEKAGALESLGGMPGAGEVANAVIKTSGGSSGGRGVEMER